MIAEVLFLLWRPNPIFGRFFQFFEPLAIKNKNEKKWFQNGPCTMDRMETPSRKTKTTTS